MKKLFCVVFFSLCTPLIACKEKGITVSTKPGASAQIDIPNFHNPGSLKFDLSLDELNAGKTPWAPSIYFAIFKENGANSFRLSLIQNNPGEQVTATAEYIESGNPVFRKALITGIPLKATVSFDVSWAPDGTIKYSAMNGTPVEIKTDLRDFNAEVHIASATATFYPK